MNTRSTLKNSVHDIVRRSATSQRFPDVAWLESVGFTMSKTRSSDVATITIDNYDREFSKARVELRLSLYKNCYDEWVTDVISYDEKGLKENEVGLVGSWAKTRSDVVRLCKALGVQLWRTKQ